MRTNTVQGQMERGNDSFVRRAIDSKLSELRERCAIEMEGLRHAQDPRSYWGTDSGTSTYWADLKARCATERVVTHAKSLKELANFIAEHRPLMGESWIGNDHGRLCWAPFLGGLPIGQHYCQAEEGHAGPHSNTIGAWPRGVTNGQQWHRLLATLPLGSTGLEAPSVESKAPSADSASFKQEPAPFLNGEDAEEKDLEGPGGAA